MNKRKKKMAEMPSINFFKKDNDYENNVCKHQEGLKAILANYMTAMEMYGEALNRSRGCACV